MWAPAKITGVCLIASMALSACGGIDSAPKQPEVEEERETIWDLFNRPDQNTAVAVNKYLWRASMDVLNFLPVEAADPFTGVIVYDWGRAPGSPTLYRATVYVSDPALDARSLRVAVQTRSGTASAETQRQIENAILTRARQLRINGANL